MNLSKIAVGVAVSFYLISNTTLAKAEYISIEDKIGLKYNNIFQENGLDKIDLDSINIANGPIKIEDHHSKALMESYAYASAIELLNSWKTLNITNNPKYYNKDKREMRDYSVYHVFKFINDEINTNEDLINKNSNDIKSTISKIDKLYSEKADIKEMEKNIVATTTTNKKLIEENKKNINTNKSSIEGNKKSMSELNAKIELNHKSIQDVKSQLNARLNNLNKDLRRGLATQSALTGLFQPYSVGKMNVTAAVGGYQSEKAIAVGSGYRFNDNFAAKVGLSKSLGGSAVSYNMGVNYEF
ncbi:YadA C-terminal domain-containing protein [Pasteurella canis]|uniref:YadA C-terminal domain-containing protein n=1 Tax=Pasteurella canis TaxID=753 RepID=UPI001CC4FACD|nr:YadA C-terminal domain-containing protein [Pasteurella canis]